MVHETKKGRQSDLSYASEIYPSYPKGVHALKEEGEIPLNITENLEARMKDKKLFKVYQDSCTAIHYRGDNLFKIIMDSPHLLNIPENFPDPYMIVDYNETKGIELDMNKSRYNQDLTKTQFLDHEAWYVSFGGKLHKDGHRDARVVKKMEEFAEEFYDEQGHETGMGYYLRSNPNAGELRELVLYSGGNDSGASDFDTLNTITFFVRCSPK